MRRGRMTQAGRFESQDPQQPDSESPVTIDPYAYAGDMPSLVTDPVVSGGYPATPACTPEQIRAINHGTNPNIAQEIKNSLRSPLSLAHS